VQGLLFVAYIGLAFVQLVAFMEGLDTWLGFGSFLSILTFVIAVFLGPLGGVAIAVVGFVGAMEGWGWEWWQAGLLCFPFLVLSFLVVGLSSIVDVLRLRRRKE